MQRKSVQLVAVLCLLLLLWIIHSDLVGSLLHHREPSDRQQDEPTLATEDELLQRIEQGAKQSYIPAVNAVIDRVWKAIPGYNGLEVDIGRTYRLALQSGKNEEIPWVYREITPRITLADLPSNPIYKGNPKKPMVSIMINVAWGNEFLNSILRTLDAEHVKATFFLDGTWLSKNQERAKEILRRGHELSNHGFSHQNMSQLSRSRAEQEMIKTEKLLKQLMVHNTLFAPPSGDYDAETVEIAHEHGLHTILWTIDTVDWKHPDPRSIIRKISQRAEPGALILMHPTSSSAAALPEMIRTIKRQGLVMGTVSELITSRRISDIKDLKH